MNTIGRRRTTVLCWIGLVVPIGLMALVLLAASMGTARAEGVRVDNQSRFAIEVRTYATFNSLFCALQPNRGITRVEPKQQANIDLVGCYVGQVDLWIGHGGTCELRVKGDTKNGDPVNWAYGVFYSWGQWNVLPSISSEDLTNWMELTCK